MKLSTRMRWTSAVSLLAGLGVTGWVLRSSGVGVGDALGHVGPVGHGLALLVFAVELGARGMRIVFVARGLGIPLRLGTSVSAQIAGDTAGSVTPARSGSDPAKLYWLRKDGVDTGSGGALLLAELMFEASVLVVLAGFIALGPSSTRWTSLGLLGYAVVVVGAASVVLLVARRTGARSTDRMLGLRLGAARVEAVRSFARTLEMRTRALRDLPAPHVAGALAMTGLHIAARAAILPVLLGPDPGGAGIATLTPETLLVPLFLLYGTALLPPPGGGGGVEAAFTLLLDQHLGGVEVAAVLIWWRLYTFYLSAILGGILLVGLAARAKIAADTPSSHDPSPDGTTCSTTA